MSDLIPIERIENKIVLIRGQKVLLDRDLADLYGVTTGNLNKAVSRNLDRFPEDFMFSLTKKELDDLIFQNGTSRWGERAVKVNIAIMRAFAHPKGSDPFKNIK